MSALELFLALVGAWATTRVMRHIPAIAYIRVVLGTGLLTLLTTVGFFIYGYYKASKEIGREFTHAPVMDKLEIAWLIIRVSPNYIPI